MIEFYIEILVQIKTAKNLKWTRKGLELQHENETVENLDSDDNDVFNNTNHKCSGNSNNGVNCQSYDI